ncbi:MAG TPA: hypothetical protein VHL05_15015 [Terriglobales bacterium]|jgi:hypothetical protein|nr:hypothetical protein [Terriglobales bacterium]
MTNRRGEIDVPFRDLDDTLLTNIGNGFLSFGKADYDRQACIREAVRLYGRDFGVRIEETAYDRNGYLIPGYISLHVIGRRRDLSTFWRLHDALSFEVAKA